MLFAPSIACYQDNEEDDELLDKDGVGDADDDCKTCHSAAVYSSFQSTPLEEEDAGCCVADGGGETEAAKALLCAIVDVSVAAVAADCMACWMSCGDRMCCWNTGCCKP